MPMPRGLVNSYDRSHHVSFTRTPVNSSNAPPDTNRVQVNGSNAKPVVPMCAKSSDRERLATPHSGDLTPCGMTVVTLHTCKFTPVILHGVESPDSHAPPMQVVPGDQLGPEKVSIRPMAPIPSQWLQRVPIPWTRPSPRTFPRDSVFIQLSRILIFLYEQVVLGEQHVTVVLGLLSDVSEAPPHTLHPAPCALHPKP